jgi:uncharacterized membrane protein YhaH (DUF805 family)
MDPQAVIEVFRRNLTEHYFDLNGRVSRQEFWYFVLATFVVYIAAAIIDAVVHTGLLGAVVGLALLLPMTGLGARRLQDTGQNGSLIWVWTIASGIMQVIALLTAISGPFGVLAFLYMFLAVGWLISLVALVVSIALIYFWVQPGTVGPNAYGPDPKAGDAPAKA